MVEEGPKGAAAKEVQAEEGGFAQVAAPEEEEGSRQLGKVKVSLDHETDDNHLFETLLIVYSRTTRRRALPSLRPAREGKSEPPILRLVAGLAY